MVLGRQTSESTQYGRQDFTVEPYEDLDLATQLRYAIQNIGGKYEAAELPDLGENETIQDTIPADPNVKNYSYAVVDGEVYYRENSVMVKPNLNATAKERVKGMAELRDCVYRLIDLQMWESDDISIRAEQQKLNRLYDRFTEKYGLINSRGNALAFADDSSYYLLCSLELLDDEDKTKLKGKQICSPSAPSGNGSPSPAWTLPQKPSPCPSGKKPAWIWRICPSSPARVRTTSSTS